MKLPSSAIALLILGAAFPSQAAPALVYECTLTSGDIANGEGGLSWMALGYIGPAHDRVEIADTVTMQTLMFFKRPAWCKIQK